MKVMSKLLLSIICLSLIFFMVDMTNAQAGRIPKAGSPPVIDGTLDGVWYSTTNAAGVIRDNSMPDSPEDLWYDDYFAFRAMWDADNLYIFVEVRDDVIYTEAGNSYENDSIELFCDANNSKGTSVDGLDDVQIRWEYLDATTADLDLSHLPDFPIGNVEFAIVDVTHPDDSPGWNLEFSIPMADLSLDLVDSGDSIGFEVQLNENDGEGRDAILRWWGDDNAGWNNPSYWGVATLCNSVADSVMKVVKAASAPTIDGVLDNVWLTAIETSQNTYVTLPAADNPYADLSDYGDLHVSFRTMWDEDAFYFFVEVIDDTIYAIGTDPWNLDGFEICIDGNNAKTAAYDGDDVQHRWVHGITEPTAGGFGGPGVWAWGVLTDPPGYTFELKILAADLTQFPLELDQVIGIEVQVNDNEGTASRENMARWWGNDNIAWSTPSLWGTAILAAAVPSVVSPEPKVAGDFRLSQNYPNPFNPTTTINFTIDERSTVKLTVYNILGNEIATLINEVKTPGSYTASFDGSNLTSGVYFYKLEAGADVFTKKMMLLK